MNSELKLKVERATVRVKNKGGQGVLVPGGYILTSAQCIAWSDEGGMAIAGHFLERLETRMKKQFLTTLCAAEPLADIAALTGLDSHTAFDEAMKFAAFREATEPIPLCNRILEVGESMSVHVFTHAGDWVKATLTQTGEVKGDVAFKSEETIKAGSLGGPVTDDAGYLVGVVSSASVVKRWPKPGRIPVASLALPRWLLERIAAATAEKK